MSQTFLDRHQMVGYKFDDKLLVVCLTPKMAEKMKADGWDVSFEKDVGHFVQISLTN